MLTSSLYFFGDEAKVAEKSRIRCVSSDCWSSPGLPIRRFGLNISPSIMASFDSTKSPAGARQAGRDRGRETSTERCSDPVLGVGWSPVRLVVPARLSNIGVSYVR